MVRGPSSGAVFIVGRWRNSLWSFRERKGTHSPAIGAKTSQTLALNPCELSGNTLADTAFGTVELLHGIRKLKYHAVTGLAQ